MDNTYYILVHGGQSKNQRLKREVKTIPLSDMEKMEGVSSWGWYDSFRSELKSKGKKPIFVVMPYDKDAIYEEWEERLNQVFNQLLISSKVYLVGHSLGALALQIYLAKNNVKQEIKQVHFVSPTVKEGVFVANQSWGHILDQCKDNHIWHSIDDKSVPYSDGVKFNNRLIGSKMHTFRNRGHFGDKDFPELVDFLMLD